MTLTGDTGAVYRIEASTNLLNWVSVIALTNSTGVMNFTDSIVVGSRQRFYRAAAP